MKTPEELQTDLDKALESIKKLEAKNSEVIGKLKEADTAAAKALADKEAAQEKADREAGNITALEQRLTAKYEKQLQELTKRADEATQTLKSYRSETEIAQAIAASNVDSKHARAITAMFKMDMKLDQDGNPTIEGKSIADYAKDYFATDGLSYVRAADNSGGGAMGNDGTKVSNNDFTKENFSSRMTEWSMLSVSNPALAKAIATQVGRSDLAADL